MAEGGLGCEAIGDGATVEINEDVDYEPDVLVECGDRTSNDALAASSPTIVVEVLSPSTRRIDLGSKRLAYEAAGVPASRSAIAVPCTCSSHAGSHPASFTMVRILAARSSR